MKKRNVKRHILHISFALIASLFLSSCEQKYEYVEIPVPDESHVVIDEVTLEQIEERARELEKKYCVVYGTMEYEEILILLVAANYEYLTEEDWQQWHEEKVNYTDDRTGVCLDYRTWTGFTWEFIYDVNKWGDGSTFEKRPRLAELFFDDDLIAQAEFIEKQIYNYVYQQDEHAMYNLCSYVLSQEHPMMTEYAPFHYEGEMMDGSAGYIINSVAYEVTIDTICWNEDVDGYQGGEELFHSCKPDIYTLFSRES